MYIVEPIYLILSQAIAPSHPWCPISQFLICSQGISPICTCIPLHVSQLESFGNSQCVGALKPGRQKHVLIYFESSGFLVVIEGRSNIRTCPGIRRVRVSHQAFHRGESLNQVWASVTVEPQVMLMQRIRTSFLCNTRAIQL